jgi:hypothetical protein
MRVCLIALLLFSLPACTDPMPSSFPHDAKLIEIFEQHREVFQRVAQLAMEDAAIASSPTNDTLSETRRKEYAQLLDRISPHVQLTLDPSRIVFWFAMSGILSIGPESGKGIAFLPRGPARVGRVLSSLDTDPGHDDVYLRDIGNGWFIIFQRLDFDR